MFNSKKIGLSLLITLMIVVTWIPSSVKAKEDIQRPPAPLVGSPAQFNSMSASNLSYGIQSTEYLKIWGSSIGVVSGNNIKVGGFTETYGTVDTVAVKVYLQYWNSSSSQWLDSVYAGEWINTNSSSVTATKNYTVSSNYYYRTRTVNYAVENGTVEQSSSNSDYFFID